MQKHRRLELALLHPDPNPKIPEGNKNSQCFIQTRKKALPPRTLEFQKNKILKDWITLKNKVKYPRSRSKKDIRKRIFWARAKKDLKKNFQYEIGDNKGDRAFVER